MNQSHLIKGFDVITPVEPVLNSVHLGKKNYHRTVITCGICGNMLHPYADRKYCKYCRTTVKWNGTGITPSNFKGLGVRITNKHNIY